MRRFDLKLGFGYLKPDQIQNLLISWSHSLALNPPADDPQPRYTYSTIGLYRAALFAQPWCNIPAGNPQGVAAALVHLLRAGMALGTTAADT